MNYLKDTLRNGARLQKAIALASQGENQTEADRKAAMLDAAAKQALLDAAAGQDNVPDVVYTDTMRLDATHVIREWAETDDLGEGEGYGDRLLALVVGTAADSDTDLTEDEVDYAGMVAELVGDLLESKGIPEADVDALIGDGSFDNDVAERVHEALLDKMPTGEDAMNDEAARFVDGTDEDGDMLDATYRKKVVVRAGKKVRLNKRIAGNIRLTAAQKSAVRKMQRKAFSGAAKMKRAKSMRLRKKLGL